MNKLISMGIGAMIVIATIAVMIPLTMEFSNEIHSMVPNEGGSSYDIIETHETVTLEYIGGIGYINNEKLPEISDSYGSVMLMFGDSFVVRYTNNGTNFSFINSDSAAAVEKITFSDGTWTTTISGNQTTGSYDFIMRWVDKGTGDFTCFTDPINKFIDSNAPVYIAQASLSSAGGGSGVWSGTLNDLTPLFDNNENVPFTYTKTQVSNNPNVDQITEWTSVEGVCLFIPSEYSLVTGVDNMTRTIVTLSPLFIGIMLFAVTGTYITRFNK